MRKIGNKVKIFFYTKPLLLSEKKYKLYTMIEPKLFYRELDSVLTKISMQESGDTFFSAILSELEQKFGAALGISRSHVYELRGEAFELVHSSAGSKGFTLVKSIPSDAESVMEVLEHGSFIYHDPQQFRQFGMPP